MQQLRRRGKLKQNQTKQEVTASYRELISIKKVTGFGRGLHLLALATALAHTLHP